MMRIRRSSLFLLLGWTLAIALRLVFLWRARENFDLATWRLEFSVLDRHGSLYRETLYNHAPLWAGLLLAIGRTARDWGWSFVTSVCTFLNLVDVAIAALVWRIVRVRANRNIAAVSALLAFAHPISVIVSSYLGQFDNIAIVFLLIAVALSTSRPPGSLGLASALGASLVAKHVAWFHPLLLARGPSPRRFWTAALPYALFLVSFLPFWRSWRFIRDHVFLYRGGPETFGLEPLRDVSWLPRETATLLFVAALLLAVWLLRRVEFGRACLLLFLVQLVLIPGVWSYYFVWPVALGAIFPSVGYLVYTLVVTAFLIKSPDVLGLDWPHLPGWWGCWWATVFWLLWEIRSLLGSRRPPQARGASLMDTGSRAAAD
jgi:hypothetical protein